MHWWHGAQPSEDLRGRLREAAEVNDAVVQSIVTAQLARRLGRHEESDAALDGALQAARTLLSRLLDEASDGRPQDAGDFVRASAAAVGRDAAGPRPRTPSGS